MRETFKKDVIIDYTKEEFLEKYDIEENYFKDSIKDLLMHYNIKREELKRSSDNGMYELQYDIADIFEIMLKNFKSSPFYKKRKSIGKKTVEDINRYNNKIIEEIDKLPDYLQFYIKSDDNYEFNFLLMQTMPIIIDRLTVLFKIITTKSDRDVGTTFGTLIEHIDAMIDEYSKEDLLSKWRDENLELKIKNVKKNNKAQKTYNIDYILKNAFDNFYREDFSKFNENIPEEFIDKLIQKNSKNDNINESKLDKIRNIYKNRLNDIEVNSEKFKIINYNIKKLKENSSEVSKIHKIPNVEHRYGSICKQEEVLRDELRLLCISYDIGDNNFTSAYHMELAPFALKILEDNKKYRDNLIKEYSKKYVELAEACHKRKSSLPFYYFDEKNWDANEQRIDLETKLQRLYKHYSKHKEMCYSEYYRGLADCVVEIYNECEKHRNNLIKQYPKEIINMEEEAYKKRIELFKDIDNDYGKEIKNIFNIAFGQMLISIMNKESNKKKKNNK